jgi:hypothetical protein
VKASHQGAREVSAIIKGHGHKKSGIPDFDVVSQDSLLYKGIFDLKLLEYNPLLKLAFSHP